MMSVLFTLWQCHSEDFNLAENNPKRNNSDFFKHDSSGGLTGRAGVDYVSILEDYNDEHNFLATMPDQEGMPIWGKMKVIDTQEATGLMIPLSFDNETLSSLLFVIVDSENMVKGTNNITNEHLKELVYNAEYSKALREKLMNSFIMMDYEVFGNDFFCNIPEDLYIGHKIDGNRLVYGGNQGNLTTLYTQSATNKAMVVEETSCTTTYHCTHHGGQIGCDGCPECQTTTCSTVITVVFTDDEDFPKGGGDTPGDGGGGVGNGDAGGPTEPGQPKDPCASSSAFYRLMPSCAGSDTDIPLMNPCEKIKVQRADNEFSKRQDSLQGKTGLTKETGYIQKWGGSYEYKDNGGSTANTNTLALPEVASNTYIKGYMHTHINDATNAENKGIKMFSPADVAYFMDLVKNAQTQGHSLSDVYGTMVTSTGNYQIRFTGNQYQIKTFTKQDTDYHNDSYSNFMKDFMINSKKLELGFLKYIQKEMLLYGITLYRMNSDGTTTEIKLNTDKTDTIENNCPN